MLESNAKHGFNWGLATLINIEKIFLKIQIIYKEIC